MSHIKPRHWAALSTFIILIASIAVVSVVSSLRNNPNPVKLGEFESLKTKTEVYQAGNCQIFITQFGDDENGGRYFFSCDKK
jgi:hypothetical protein